MSFQLRSGQYPGRPIEEKQGGDRALVFAVAPAKAFGFRKGDFSQTRWRFQRG
ncbi:hypothetical protein AB0L53_31165 [Nonomuraea sp. NPDC052129]|uniref:hypothetical protein n=1 Tax=Nonomuraea sp. NPDC052129 TaxID=3154651 RepID=UPI00343CE1F1